MKSIITNLKIYIGKNVYVHDDIYTSNEIVLNDFLATIPKVAVNFPTKYRADILPYHDN
jgi:hypothetical protein